MHKYIIYACFLSLSPFLALSQESGEIEEIIVSGLKIQQSLEESVLSISVVDAQDISNGRQNLGIDESLARVPGLFMQNRYNFAQDLRVSIRGFGARSSFGIRGVKIYVDGIPETLPDGQGQVDNIDINAISSIEVIRGPSSALYGNASGGVINIFTAEPEANSFSVDVGQGDFGYRSINFEQNYSQNNHSLALNLTSKELDGYRDNNEHQNQQVSLRLHSDFNSSTSLISSFNYTRQPVSQDPGGINFNQLSTNRSSAYQSNILYDAGESLSQARMGISLIHNLQNSSQINLRGYTVKRAFVSNLPLKNSGQIDLSRDFYGIAGFIQSEHEIRSMPFTLQLGFESDFQRDHRKRWDNDFGNRGIVRLDQSENVDNIGIYAQTIFSLSDNLILNIGLRNDRLKYDVIDSYFDNGDESGQLEFSDTSPMLGLNYGINEKIRLFANFSSSFEAPTTTELAGPYIGGFNTDLKSQSAQSKEIGFRYGSSGSDLYMDVAIFDISVTGELVPYELEAFPGRDFYENAGSSTRKGFELGIYYHLNEELSLNFAYTKADYVFDEFEDYSGNRIPGLPNSLSFLELIHTNLFGFHTTLNVLSVSDQFANNANSTVNPNYQTANLIIAKSIMLSRWNLKPYFGIYNLTNEQYNQNVRINAFGGRFFEPAPPKNYYLGFQLTQIEN
ncbi:MAG: TonB-dependent receptor family protein [Gammaproteobacteria bacterium]